eukprot:1161555-Pelagomonas_calceolata.AAC.15
MHGQAIPDDTQVLQTPDTSQQGPIMNTSKGMLHSLAWRLHRGVLHTVRDLVLCFLACQSHIKPGSREAWQRLRFGMLMPD